MDGGKRSGGCVRKINGLVQLSLQRFDWLIGVVCCLHSILVLLECFQCDVAILRAHVNDELPSDNIHVPCDVVLHCDGVNIYDNTKEELFQKLLCCLIISPHTRILSVHSRRGCDLDSGAGDCCVRIWVGWGEKADG